MSSTSTGEQNTDHRRRPAHTEPPGGADLRQVRDTIDETGRTTAYQLASDSSWAIRIGPTEADDILVSVEDLLPADRASGYVCVHRPVEDLLPIVHAARDRSVLTVYDQTDREEWLALQPRAELEASNCQILWMKFVR
ncbi:MAG: hypothetical protein HOV87_09650 [Catenulispora sp.]|nr:hypothetical protein [Catenulispora sp.]